MHLYEVSFSFTFNNTNVVPPGPAAAPPLAAPATGAAQPAMLNGVPVARIPPRSSLLLLLLLHVIRQLHCVFYFIMSTNQMILQVRELSVRNMAVRAHVRA